MCVHICVTGGLFKILVASIACQLSAYAVIQLHTQWVKVSIPLACCDLVVRRSWQHSILTAVARVRRKSLLCYELIPYRQVIQRKAMNYSYLTDLLLLKWEICPTGDEQLLNKSIKSADKSCLCMSINNSLADPSPSMALKLLPYDHQLLRTAVYFPLMSHIACEGLKNLRLFVTEGEPYWNYPRLMDIVLAVWQVCTVPA